MLIVHKLSPADSNTDTHPHPIGELQADEQTGFRPEKNPSLGEQIPEKVASESRTDKHEKTGFLRILTNGFVRTPAASRNSQAA